MVERDQCAIISNEKFPVLRIDAGADELLN